MNMAAMHLEPVFFWLLRATAQASVLVCVILLFQRALGRRLGIRERCLLWVVPVVGLVLLWAPHSPIRVDGRLLRPAMKDHISSLVRGSNRVDNASAATDDIFAQEDLFAQRHEETLMCQSLPWPASWGLDAPPMRILALLWLAGTGVFAGYIAYAHIRFHRLLAKASPVTDHEILSLLDNCKQLLGVRAHVDVLSTEAIDSPALFGCRRPRLLLSRDLLAQLNPDELRHILLHELAHLKRRDIFIAHIVSFVQALQWFNPLVALAFRRMRADREMACDALALSVLGSDEAYAYGRTVVRQLERLRTTRQPPILAAITGDKARVKQRIALIAAYDNAKRRRSPLMIAFVVSLACAALAIWFAASEALGGAVESAVVTWEVRARRDLPTTHQDKHTNIQRACIRNELTGKFLTADGERLACEADEPGEAGLWEIRFDEVSNAAENDVYLYSVAARRYLTTDEEGNVAVSARKPEPAARWGTYARPQGIWLISHHFKDGYLRRSENGQVKAAFLGRDGMSYWDIHTVWRIKTSDDPKSNPQWQREKIPGPD